MKGLDSSHIPVGRKKKLTGIWNMSMKPERLTVEMLF